MKNRREDSKYSRFQALYLWDFSHESAGLRVFFLIVFFLLCFGSVSIRLLSIACSEEIKTNTHYVNKVYRKEITDRNGHVLAISLPSASLFANPSKLKEPEESLNKLSKIIPDLDKAKLLKELSGTKRFVWIKHDLTPEAEAEIVRLGLPGFGFEREQKRIYTLGSLFSHVVGYTGRDSEGLAGIEKKYDLFLKTPEKNTEDKLELTLDSRVQGILSSELDATISKFRAKGGSAILVNPRNGEVLGLVSKPDFDPNDSIVSSGSQFFNSAVQGVYEIGSVFKVLTLAVGLDTKMIGIHDAYDISHLRIGKFPVNDYHPMRGWHSVGEIFLHSSNIGASQIMMEVGYDNVIKYFRALSLLSPLDIELPERAVPLAPTRERWSDITLATISFGYGLSISPLHFVQAMVPVVNGGYLIPLTLVKKVGDLSKESKNPIRVFDGDTSIQMRKLMRLVVTHGTGKKAEVKGYMVGGKTGTANKSQRGGYAKNSRLSSFCGIMPSHNPQFLIYVIIDDPQPIAETHGFATSGWTAAPTVGRILSRLVSLYGMTPEDEEDPKIKDILKIDYKIDQSV